MSVKSFQAWMREQDKLPRYKRPDLEEEEKQQEEELRRQEALKSEGWYAGLDRKVGGLLPGGVPGGPSMSDVGNWVDRAGQTGAEIMTTVDNPNKATTGSKFGDVSADLWGGLMGFAVNPVGGVRSAGAQLFGAGEKAVEKGLSLIPAAERLPGIARTGLKLGGATIPYEATMAAVNDREFSPGEAGMAGAANAGLGMLLHGAGSALNRNRGIKTEPAPMEDAVLPETTPIPVRQKEIAKPIPEDTDILAQVNTQAISDTELPSLIPKRLTPEVAAPTVKLNRKGKGNVNIEFPDQDHAMLYDFAIKMNKLDKNYNEQVNAEAEQMYGVLKDKFPDVIKSAESYRKSVIDTTKNIKSGQVVTAPTFVDVKAKADIPVNKRTFKNVGDRKINAMQFNHPELKPHIQEGAKSLLHDLNASLKGERGGTTVDGGYGVGPQNVSWGNKRMTSNTIAEILDRFKVTYADIENALTRIINDQGQENTALAKRIELLIDENLTNGHTLVDGIEIKPSQGYVSAKNKVYGTNAQIKENKPMSDEDWNWLEQNASGELGNKGAVQGNSIPKQELPITQISEQKQPTQQVSTPNKITPDMKRKVFRGKDGQVNVVFPDAIHADLFDFWGKLDKSIKGGKKINLEQETSILRHWLNIGKNENMLPIAKAYRDRVISESKNIGAGETLVAPKFNDTVAPEKSGTYNPGTIGSAKLTLPEKQSVIPGTNEKVRSFQRTAIDSPVTDADTKVGLLVDIYAGGPGAYKPITNLETEAAARQFISDNGLDAAINRVMDKTETSAEQTALAGQVTYALQKQGKHEQALNMLESLADQLTAAGQKIQAVKIFQNLSPEGVLIKAQKETKKAFNELPQPVKQRHDNLSNKLQQEFDNINKQAVDQVINENPQLAGTPEIPAIPGTTGSKLPEAQPGDMPPLDTKPITPKGKKINPPKAADKKQPDPATLLAQRIKQYVSDKPKTDPVNEIVRTLFGKAREVIPKEKGKIPAKRDELKEVVNALNSSEKYRQVWNKAKVELVKKYKDTPQVIKDVEAYIQHYLNVPYSERSIERILQKAIKDKEFDVEKSAFGPLSPTFTRTDAINKNLIQRIMSESGLTGRNAETLAMELGTKLEETLKNKRDAKTSQLAKQIIGMTINKPQQRYNDPVKEMFSTLLQKARESVPKQPTIKRGIKQGKDDMIPLFNALNNRSTFNAVWAATKKDIAAKLEKEGISVEGANLDQLFAELLYHPYSQGQLNKAVGQGVKNYGIDLGQLVRQHFSLAETTGQSLAEKLTVRGMLNKDEAAVLAQDIQKRFNELTASQKQQILDQMFKQKGKAKQKPIDQKLIEMSNLGAFSKEQYRRAVAEKLNLPVLTEDVAKTLTELAEKAQMAEGREAEILRAQMVKIIAEQTPTPFWRKVSSVQSMAMLLNPKTAIRNIGGNAGFNVLENVSDVVGAGIDKGIGLVTGKRSKVLPSVTAQARGFMQGGKEGIQDAMLGIDTLGFSGKFDLPRSRVFKGGIMGKLETALNVELKATDRAFYKAAYEGSLKNQMVAAKATKPTEKMLETAHLDGLYRTFQDENALSKGFVIAKRILNADKEWGLGDAVIRFPKTPANLLMRGIDYSPAGFVKTIIEAARPLAGREFNQKAFVESFSRAVVGSTALFGTGVLLHKLGIITGRPNADQDLAALERQNGFGEYRINASAFKRLSFGNGNTKPQKGDSIISYDWYQPSSIGIAIGADIDANKGKATGIVGTILSALGTSLNAFAEQPSTQGLRTMMSGQKGDFSAGLMKVLQGIPASFVPTLLNQIKQLADNQQRETYSPNWQEQAINKVKGRIPGMSNSLPQKYGTLGQKLETYQGGSNSLGNVFLNPAFMNEYNPSPSVQKVKDVYDKTGEIKQVPRVADKSIKVGDKVFQLTGEEFSEYQRLLGEKTDKGFSKVNVGKTDKSAENAVGKMQGIMNKANQDAKLEILKSMGLKASKKGSGIALK